MAIGAVAASLLAIQIAAATMPTVVEAKGALAEACSGLVSTDVSAVRCRGVGDDEPTEAVCTYRVRVAGKLLRDSTYFAVDATGWHLIDTPAYCPAASRK